ncbi:peptide-methionine (S)-S-oxide reductase MsrA [Photobacterium sp. DNB23_23_1]|uniref:Peptide methionine sulfoxide reductase MsrA n=1 Tax=Photobacterium pectinilyticum TaxID=2906793 RepID=A0ABT1N840_9GAMM|nr:peptide-methionine (S)-S-oxide reductase MsrA [Photobacterium sp. ZSDE20]MCQ1060922.1 peptide-methionine (S)-S-oxide reductase MsrA [Photobacterium sp. ZSDE20]MDD1828790.1 peptide-methionine (S)-S-oxide reductase MsrA [Photobacterium sp. ZSDE20]
MSSSKQILPTESQALIGRATPMMPSLPHAVNGTQLNDEIPQGMEVLTFGMGCFWGAERLFWKQTGIYSTAVGYSGGITPNPNYKEVCTGQTGHNEVVRVIFDPQQISLNTLLTLFWENHDPTQGMRQGNDVGTQYRSAIYTYSDQHYQEALASKARYQQALLDASITTEILPAGTFYFAEDYHQQYLAKNPNGYCGLGGTGICMPPQ